MGAPLGIELADVPRFLEALFGIGPVLTTSFRVLTAARSPTAGK
jgi:hypothetical protein